MNAREVILTKIRTRKNKIPKDKMVPLQKESLRPAYSQVTGTELLKLFLDKLLVSKSTYEVIDTINKVPESVEKYLKKIGYGYPIRISPLLENTNLQWKRKASYGKARNEDRISVVKSPCGVAETGTLVHPSSPETPSTLNFMAEVSIVIVNASDIVPNYEDAWQKVIEHYGTPPRTVNFITGPSRTADIAQTLLLGVHGPRLLHVLVIDSK